MPERYAESVLKLIDFTYDHEKDMQEGRCYIKLKNLDKKNMFKNCKNLNLTTGNKKIYLWGDSTAAHLHSGIKHKYSKNYKIYHKSGATCKPLLEINNKCKNLNNIALKEIIDLNPDKVFLSAWWQISDIPQIFKIINKLKNNGINGIYLVGASVRWSDRLPKLLLKEHRYTKKIPKYLKDKNHIINYNLDKKLREFSNEQKIIYLSPFSVFCKPDACLTKVGDSADSIVTWDENHFTKKASIYLFDNFDDE